MEDERAERAKMGGKILSLEKYTHMAEAVLETITYTALELVVRACWHRRMIEIPLLGGGTRYGKFFFAIPDVVTLVRLPRV